MKIFTGNANPALAKEICEHLGVPLGTATVNRFPDGETFVQINENIRGCDVYVIQPTCAPANDRIMELLIMIDALRRASAARITAVIPFFGYARQDRKDKPRVPITAKLVANLLVYPDNLKRNMELTGGLYASQSALLMLTEKGLDRKEAYEAVQRAAMKTWKDGGGLAKNLSEEPTVSKHLNTSDIERACAPERHFRFVDDKFRAVGIEG